MSISEIKPSFIKRMKDKVKKMKQDTLALYYAYRHPDTPFTAKFLIGVTIGYLMSPIDLIPDFIPILGLLDDLLIVPFLIVLSIRLIPKKVWEASLERAILEPIEIKKVKWFVVIIVLIWLLASAGIYFYLLPSLFTQS
jgi:uncharacterized membrane protein YkvA (DUF1232 family)